MAIIPKNFSQTGNISGYVGTTGADILIHIGPTDTSIYQDILITTYGGGGTTFLYYSVDGGTTKIQINSSSGTVTTKFRIQGNATPVRVYINTATAAASCYGFVHEISSAGNITSLGFSQVGSASIKTGANLTNFLLHIGPTDPLKYQDIVIAVPNALQTTITYSVDGGTTLKTINTVSAIQTFKFRIQGNATPVRVYLSSGASGCAVMGFIQEVTP